MSEKRPRLPPLCYLASLPGNKAASEKSSLPRLQSPHSFIYNSKKRRRTNIFLQHNTSWFIFPGPSCSLLINILSWCLIWCLAPLPPSLFRSFNYHLITSIALVKICPFSRPPIHHLIIIPVKVEELRNAGVYLCSRMSQAILIFSAVFSLSLWSVPLCLFLAVSRHWLQPAGAPEYFLSVSRWCVPLFAQCGQQK